MEDLRPLGGAVYQMEDSYPLCALRTCDHVDEETPTTNNGSMEVIHRERTHHIASVEKICNVCYLLFRFLSFFCFALVFFLLLIPRYLGPSQGEFTQKKWCAHPLIYFLFRMQSTQLDILNTFFGWFFSWYRFFELSDDDFLFLACGAIPFEILSMLTLFFQWHVIRISILSILFFSAWVFFPAPFVRESESNGNPFLYCGLIVGFLFLVIGTFRGWLWFSHSWFGFSFGLL